MYFYDTFPGDHSEEVTPVPIPNTEVKSLSGEGTAAFGCGRVARCRVFFLGLRQKCRSPFFVPTLTPGRDFPHKPVVRRFPFPYSGHVARESCLLKGQ